MAHGTLNNTRPGNKIQGKAWRKARPGATGLLFMKNGIETGIGIEVDNGMDEKPVSMDNDRLAY